MGKENLFENENAPVFKLSSFCMESMEINVTKQCLDRFLHSSKQSLKKLVLQRRDPFRCTHCGQTSPCKLAKCAICSLCSYCNRKCQSVHWSIHQMLCQSRHRNLSSNVAMNHFLASIASFCSLTALDLSHSFVVSCDACNVLTSRCPNLSRIDLNGCDASNEAIL